MERSRKMMELSRKKKPFCASMTQIKKKMLLIVASLTEI